MRTETRIKVLAKCYLKNKTTQSEYMNGMAIEIADGLTELEKNNPEAWARVKDHLTEIGYYARS